MPDYRDLEPTWGNCLTDLIYFSVEPLPDGELDTSRLNQDTLQTLLDIKERYGIRIHISVGGFRRSENFGPMVTNTQARENFVEKLVEFCSQHSLDGVDLDWEFPETEAEIQRYIALIKELRERGLIVSVALYPDEEVDLQLYIAADRIHIMSYDRGARHATYEQAVEDLELFTNSGIPRSKLILGIPFYGRLVTSPYTSFAYSDIQEEHNPPEDLDEAGGIFFNGMETVKRKTCHALEKGYGGVMLWELGQDSKDETSLLRTAYHAVMGGCVPWRVCPANCIRE